MIWVVQSSPANIPLTVGQIRTMTPRHPVPPEGRWRSSRTLGQVAVDAAASARERDRRAVFRERTRRARRTALMRMAKPCGPGTRCWCQAGGGDSIQPDRSAARPSATVTRRIRRRGEHGISRKAIAQGMPECSDCTCMLVCDLYAHIARETAGAACTRHSLLPLFRGDNFMQTSGASRRENANAHQLSSSAKADDPVFQRRQ